MTSFILLLLFFIPTDLVILKEILYLHDALPAKVSHPQKVRLAVLNEFAYSLDTRSPEAAERAYRQVAVSEFLTQYILHIRS